MREPLRQQKPDPGRTRPTQGTARALLHSPHAQEAVAPARLAVSAPMPEAVARLSHPGSESPRVQLFRNLQRTHGNQAVMRTLRKAEGSALQPGCGDRERPPERSVIEAAEVSEAPPIVQEVLRFPGQPLDAAARSFMESRFGHDFGRVRLHADAKAAESAQAVNALAYTVGRDIVFGTGQYAPGTTRGRALLAHELAHTIQQGPPGGQTTRPLTLGNPPSASEKEADTATTDIVGGGTPRVSVSHPRQVARQTCTSATICTPGGVTGSAEQFGGGEEAIEVGPRARRQSMTSARAVSTGHAGRARQLENFLNGQAPGRLASIQGIFIDRDLSPGTGALTQNCADWIADALPAGSPTPPGMAGATRPCTFVHGDLNQQALAFNNTTNTTIGGRPREVWRVETLQLLIHETEHPRFEAATAARARPAGVTSPTCTRAHVAGELSELAAIMSEFPSVSRSAAAEASPAGPVHASMNRWFQFSVHTGGENIEGALEQMGCSCRCPEVDAFVIDTFNAVTSAGSWSAAERAAFNSRLRAELPIGSRPSWPL